MTYKVFVSSTYLDNEERRNIVKETIERAEMQFVGMELFGASTEKSVDECVRMASEADVLVGIVAWRYGWIPPGYKCSITELEYNAAKDRLMFLPDPTMRLDPENDYDEPPDRWRKQELLDRFKSRFQEDQMGGRFNERNLGVVVFQSLVEWQKKREKGGNVRTAGLALEVEIQNYLQKAEGLHATLPIAGFSTKLRVPIDLSELYVPLRAVADLRAVGDAVFADAKEADERFREGRESLTLSLPKAFGKCRNLNRKGFVILGDPGAGKTTHLKRVLVACCRDGAESLGLPPGMVPIFLPLRELTKATGGFQSFIKSQLDDNDELVTGADFGARLLNRGNLLILLDGLDEVIEEGDRKEVARWIEKTLRDNPTCHIVVTCRYAGYSNDVRLNEHFLELHIRPLSDEQVETFVHNWYRIVETGLSIDKEQATETAKKRATTLIERLRAPEFQARRVYELTANPLLLANLCLVHRDRGELPKRRVQLYAECVDVLLERWRAGKGLPLALTADNGRRVLQPAAFFMHAKENRTRVSADELAPVIDPALISIQWQRGGAAEFLRTVRDESGLLTGWGDGTYGFMHLGFQEYLAAREIRVLSLSGDRTIVTELARQFGKSWWQEVSLLLLALEEPPLFEPYMREVIRNGGFQAHPEMVNACIEDAAQVSEKPFVEFLERDPGDDPVVWEGQLMALQILSRLNSKTVEKFTAKLQSHPSREIRAWLHGRITASEKEIVKDEPSGIELVRIPGDRFMMGSPDTEAGRYVNESPRHEVRVKDFYLARYPVTNEAYGRFLEADRHVRKPEYWGDRRYNEARQPVVGISWEDAQKYCEWAGFRLPSEAEWEYACRAGANTRYWKGDEEGDLKGIGWYVGNSDSRLHPVGEKEPNPFGLYDMHGNVWEWVEDDWHGSYADAPLDGRARVDEPRAGSRVSRGGSWDFGARYCRSAYRSYWRPGYRNNRLGFRPARSIP